MKTTHNGYSVASRDGQIDLFYSGKLDPFRRHQHIHRPLATEADRAKLSTYGVEWIRNQELNGLLDRLEASGLI
jgi:hypothetical protein